MGLNWKCPFSLFTYLITYKVEYWYFKSLCKRDTVWNRTYQHVRDKRLVRPGSKCPNWQIFQPISYKAKFSQRDNICLEDLKCNITYQNTPGENQGQTDFYTLRCLKWQKKLPNKLQGEAFYKIAKFVLTKKVFQYLTTISITKVWSDPKVNPQIDKDLNP